VHLTQMYNNYTENNLGSGAITSRWLPLLASGGNIMSVLIATHLGMRLAVIKCMR